MARFNGPAGSNLPGLKKLNRSAVLSALLRDGPCARGDLARATGLTASTISGIIGDLIANELVKEGGHVEDTSLGRTGRPPVLVSLHGPGAYAVGVHVGLGSIHLALGDLNGEIVAWHKEVTPADRRPERVLPAIREHIGRLIDSAAIPRDRLVGVGVGLVGIVDAERGVVRSMPQPGWHGVPVAATLERELDLPVVIDNSRRAMAQAEITFGVARQVQNLLFVHSYSTVGCGIAIDRQIYYGDSNASGQLGHVIVVPEGALCVCGHRGCLDTVATDEGIARLAREAVTLER
ncbi:MAG TPA: ROK family transcriptional regulator, partial [Chloroflexota bacterium]|nr:ROK family transcriptional regulator [Chloroflexota bacterium]